MVPRKKKYESGEAANFISRKQAMRKLQLNLKVGEWNDARGVLYHISVPPNPLRGTLDNVFLLPFFRIFVVCAF